MAKGLFIHDHKFPKDNNSYFFSYGFDAEFFSRYKNIFSQLNVIGREIECDTNHKQIDNQLVKDVDFFTINSYKKLLNKSTRKNIERNINDAEALIIRLPSILGLYSIYLANKIKKPYIIELVGCPWDAYWNMGFNKKLIAPMMKYLTQRAIYNSKYTIYVTEEYLQKKYPSKGKSIACSNVTLNEVNEESLIQRLESIDNFDLNKKIILGTIGTVDSIYKGQHYVIEAIRKLKKDGIMIEYHLVGGGNNEFLKKIAKKNGVEDQIVFHGKLEHSVIFNWLDGIDIYIQPSDTEGLPRSVIEAMSVACPVFGSNAGGIPELIHSSAIFEKGNIDQICHLFKNSSKDKMRNEVNHNFQNAKKYRREVLYKRREDFFKLFIENEVGVK